MKFICGFIKKMMKKKTNEDINKQRNNLLIINNSLEKNVKQYENALTRR